MNGNYEFIEGGEIGDGFNFLTGLPTSIRYIDHADPNTATNLWGYLKGAIDNNYLIGLSTCVDATYDLVPGHAYGVLGAYSVTDNNGTLHNLLRIKNPWGLDSWSGPWSDSSPLWNTVNWQAA